MPRRVTDPPVPSLISPVRASHSEMFLDCHSVLPRFNGGIMALPEPSGTMVEKERD